MLNRKRQLANGAQHHANGSHRPGARKGRRHHRFIISATARKRPKEPINGSIHSSSKGASGLARGRVAAPIGPSISVPDLTETIKTLVQLAREHGHVTYDDINDALPEGLSPKDLDELYTRLRALDIEIVEHTDVERAKPAEPEEEEDHRLEVLDDPVRMYMNQMGKVPLLTREQEVEICKRIESAEIEIKSLVYGLGFTAKEHIAIAEKLLSEPPKERFDRVVVDKKVASRERHLRELRALIKKVRALDMAVDSKFLAWQRSPTAGWRQKFLGEIRKLDKKLQEMFPKFFYKQRVLEDMIVVAGNVQEKFKTSLRAIQEIEARRKSAEQQASLQGERGKIR